jgi:hypothetical protein
MVTPSTGIVRVVRLRGAVPRPCGGAAAQRVGRAVTLDRVVVADRTAARLPVQFFEGQTVGSVIKKRRKRMAKKKHRKLLKRTRVQRRRLGK